MSVFLHERLFAAMGDFPELKICLPKGAPKNVLPLYKEGRHIEHYTNRKKLPTLSRHTVWKAEVDGQPVALKQYRADADALQACFREAALLHKCRH